MYEYQFSVSHRGVFLFRTEWMDHAYAVNVKPPLIAAFTAKNGYVVRIMRRSKLMTEITIEGEIVYFDND